MAQKHKPIDFLLALLISQCIVYITVFFDVPIARQIVGFVYFTFVPGFVFVKLLKLDKFDVLEVVLFSVGFSVAFLMIFGFLINEFLPLYGVLRPLSLEPLMIILNSLILIVGVLIHLRNENVKIFRIETFKMFPSSLLFLALPMLSIIGTMAVNIYGNNLVLMFMIVSIGLLFAIGVISKSFLPPHLYPFVVLLIAIAMLYHSSLVSNYIVGFGSDVPVEYYIFKTTQDSAHWSFTNPFPWDTGYGRTNAMLSVTILPTIYSTLLNIDSVWMFKIVFPLIFSFVPLGLYYMWKGYVGEKYAFISAFLFMAQSTFYTEMLGLTRQMIAELFFVLLFLVILGKKLEPINKTMCFVIFGVALVISHYALAEIFLFFVAVALIFFVVSKHLSRNITVTMVVFFFVVMFAWYLFTSNAAVFDSFLSFGDHIYKQLGDFFNPASRGQTVLAGLGLEAPPSIWNTISRIFAYITEALIVVGFIGLIKKRIKNHSNNEYFLFTSISMGFLAALIIVPGLASSFNMTRFYHILLFFLSPLCIIGVETLVNFVFKRKKELLVSALLLIVLGSYFIFQTGFVYELTGSESWSISLSKHRMTALQLYSSLGYVDAYSVFGAQWLSRHSDFARSQVYADIVSATNVLRVSGGVFYINVLTNVTTVKNDGVIYLSALNVVNGKIYEGRLSWNCTELSFIFDDSSLVYNNGRSMIYQNNG